MLDSFYGSSFRQKAYRKFRRFKMGMKKMGLRRKKFIRDEFMRKMKLGKYPYINFWNSEPMTEGKIIWLNLRKFYTVLVLKMLNIFLPYCQSY